MADYQSKTGRYSVKRTLSDEAKAKLAKARELALVRKKEIKAEKLAPPPEDPPPDPPEPAPEEPEPVPEKLEPKKIVPDTDDEEVHVAKPKKLAQAAEEVAPVAVKKSKKKKSKIVISNDTSSSDSDDDTPVIYIRSKKKNKKPAKKEIEESEDLPPPVNYQLHKKLDLPAYEPPAMERQAPMGITRPSWMSW
jgi:hypothetical protein